MTPCLSRSKIFTVVSQLIHADEDFSSLPNEWEDAEEDEREEMGHTIRHANAILQSGSPTLGDILSPLMEIGLDHDPHNRQAGLSTLELLGDIFRNNRLPCMLLK